MTSQNSINNKTVNAAFVANTTDAGSNAQIISNHTDNTNPGSNAFLAAQVGGAVAGDPYVLFGVAGAAGSWSLGTDNSDSDSLKEGFGAISSPSSATTTRKVTTAGEQTMPLQPVFYSLLSAPSVNATGDGTTYQIIFDTINFQVGTGYNNGTGVFTAPVTGHYYIYTAVQLSGMGASHLNGFLGIIPTGTGVGGYLTAMSPFNVQQQFFNNLIWSGSNIVRLAAGDTVVINVQVSGVAAPKTVTVDNAFFNGALLF